jgi:L-asparagine transporter-like permease
MLHSLSEQGNAPKYLSRISRNGVPLAGVLTSTGVTSLAVLVVFLWPEFAFNYLLSIALIAGIINWTMIVVTHGKFRRRLGTEETAKSSFRLPGGRFSAWIVLLFMALVIVQMAMSDDYRTAVIAGPAWLAGLLIAYAVKRRRQDVVPRSAPSKDSTLSRERMV